MLYIIKMDTINLSGKFIVLKGTQPFNQRIVLCTNQNADMLTIVSRGNTCNLNDVEYYLKLNEISPFKKGEYVTYIDYMEYGNIYYGYGQIINISYVYKNILYEVREENTNNVRCMAINNIVNTVNNKYMIGNYVSIKDETSPMNYTDGLIVDINFIENTYKIKCSTNNIVTIMKSELKSPLGFNLIKL